MHRGQYIGEGATSVEARGPHTTWPRGQGVPRAVAWCGGPTALLHFSFGPREVLWNIRLLLFVPYNSENISLSTFLKRENSRKQELALWHLVNRLVQENA